MTQHSLNWISVAVNFNLQQVYLICRSARIYNEKATLHQVRRGANSVVVTTSTLWDNGHLGDWVEIWIGLITTILWIEWVLDFFPQPCWQDRTLFIMIALVLKDNAACSPSASQLYGTTFIKMNSLITESWLILYLQAPLGPWSLQAESLYR